MNKERFIWLLNNSVKIITEDHPDSIFYYMNPMIERQIKLNNVLDNKTTITLNNIDKKYLLFEQDTKNMYLWVNYDQIWLKFESNIEYKDMSISKIIDGLLKDDTNWKSYIPNMMKYQIQHLLKDDTNWKSYIPHLDVGSSYPGLKDDTNWKSYIPSKKPKPMPMKVEGRY